MKWVTIWTTPSDLEAILAHDLLAAQGIPSHIINQKDSSYVLIGEVRIRVPDYAEEDARKLLTINGYLEDKHFLN